VLISWRSLLLTVILSMATGWLGAQMGIRWAVRTYPGPVAGAIQKTLHETLHAELKLNDEQRRRINAIETNFAPQNRLLQAQIRAVNDEVVRAVMHSLDAPEQMESATAHMASAVAALQRQTLLEVQEIQKALSDAQRAVLDDRLAELLIRRST
jgi:nickel and cobalt resistance protein CnrR